MGNALYKTGLIFEERDLQDNAKELHIDIFTSSVCLFCVLSVNNTEKFPFSRVFVVIMCVIAVLWIPMVKAFQSGRLFNYMVAVEGYVGSPLGVLFLLSIFWKRTTETVLLLYTYYPFSGKRELNEILCLLYG